ncbi:hypothetical protein D9619_008447 [Psilocybe cf. subviscida]|uniref:Nuclear pore complex protein n=1 Tax=Psilocybe cf. subviscida TaxID=2480587 RepID=A0A8H5B9K4_9AGAR|nr:hypothetical protein D9619_008447 [Psilocybe cf. subviscida]
MADNLYSACAEVLAACQSVKDDIETILDPETGFAPRMRQICRETIEDSENEAEDDIVTLRLEENTWTLLQAVIPARKTESHRTLTAKELLLENPYTPTSTLAQAIMNASPLLAELIVVREWLQEAAPTPALPEVTNGYWKFTKHTVMQNLRTGHGPREGLVSEMDPDAVNRGDGAALVADDATYEKMLLQALYGYVRAGRLEDAVEVCRRAHQPWRAASLRGSLLFRWKALSTVNLDDEDDDPEPQAWSGNRRRKLWKAACVQAALSSRLSDQERLLYASIVPTPQTVSLVKAACRTWEDHLWADINVMCEEKESRELAKLASASFWDGKEDEFERGVEEASSLPDEQDDEEWENEVRNTLVRLKDVAVAEGASADQPFHFSQLYIILDQTDTLLEVFAGGLQEGKYSQDTFEYGSMCRFFAHLCLFLKMIDIPVPPLPAQIILESYIAVLEQAGQRDLIALYAGALGDNAVDRYAAFLVSLALSADFNERRLALSRASEHGLDVERVARVTAEMTVQKAFDVLPPLKDPLPSIINRQPPPNETETLLLRSIEWTTFTEATYPNALEQATAILRYFLGAGRVNAAQSLLSLLPAELASISDPEEVATEYLHYRQFFVIWDSIAAVVDCQAQEARFAQNSGPGSNREARAQWIAQYRDLIFQAYDQIVKLLTTEWLVADVENDEGMRLELIRIRQVYVPELIIRLHYLLYSSRQLMPENLKRAVELANIVADSRYKLYEDFMNKGGRSLSEYLGAVRQAMLAGLASGGSDPFKIVASH